MQMKRFVHSGDGKIVLYSERNHQFFKGNYRNEYGTYDKKALKDICGVFGAPEPETPTGLSLRLLEFIDFMQDHFNPDAQIVITSGYRSPEYNTMIRNQGNLAAKASLHQYGMAADLKIDGVNPKKLWDFAKSLKFGGAGYYNGETVHIDVGPARSWDQNTSGVGTGISNDNKLIGIVTNFDMYHGEDAIVLRFIRMTAFPIQVNPEFKLIKKTGQGDSDVTLNFKPVFSTSHENYCPEFENITEMDQIQWIIPSDLAAGRYVVKARFCGKKWPDIPQAIETPEFEIRE